MPGASGPELSPDDQEGLPPPGSRWGAGAQSVLPYLTKTLQAKPSALEPPRAMRADAAEDPPAPSS